MLLEEGLREDQLARYSPANLAKPIQGLPIHPGFAYIWLGCPGAKAAKRKTREDLWTTVYL
ncbi:hypothetical protein LB507_007494, partial [Fusarium sp. FIESC RH6]